MVVIAKAHRPIRTSQRQVLLRQQEIRNSWSPWERRQRAIEAQAQARVLWKLIDHGQPHARH